MGKTQPSLTQPVKTGLNHTEKNTKVGKVGFYQIFSKFFCLKPDFFKKWSKLSSKKEKDLEGFLIIDTFSF